MNSPVVVSVVIGSYNGAEELSETLNSVLSQQDVALECVVVDDGSTDATWSILEKRTTTEPRLKILRQSRGGLTKALIAGCEEAQGEFVARQDLGDLSLPGRLTRQRDLLAANPTLAFAACRCQSVGPLGEALGDEEPADGGAAIISSLRTAPAGGMKGPHHGSVMFRRSAYELVGGYRPEFYFAQDLDLWARLIEVGGLAFVDEVLYQSGFAPGSISARYRPQQLLLRELIHEATWRRRRGLSESDVLKRAAQIRPDAAYSIQRADAGAEYFIGSCLYSRDDPAAMKYFRRVLAGNPFHLKAWAKLLASRVRRRA